MGLGDRWKGFTGGGGSGVPLTISALKLWISQFCGVVVVVVVDVGGPMPNGIASTG